MLSGRGECGVSLWRGGERSGRITNLPQLGNTNRWFETDHPVRMCWCWWRKERRSWLNLNLILAVSGRAAARFAAERLRSTASKPLQASGVHLAADPSYRLLANCQGSKVQAMIVRIKENNALLWKGTPRASTASRGVAIHLRAPHPLSCSLADGQAVAGNTHKFICSPLGMDRQNWERLSTGCA